MLHKWDQLRKDVELAEAQIFSLERAHGAAMQRKRDARLQLQGQLEDTMKEKQHLEDELAKERLVHVASTSNVASMPNVINNYWPRGAGPKHQLTKTDVAAYAPWK